MEFTPLRISTIKPLTDISFDLYIYFKEQYLLYINRGKALEDNHLQKLKTQKIAKFYITDQDETNYQLYLDNLLQEAMKSESTPVEEKVKLAEGAAGTAVERMQKNPGNRGAYKMTEKAANNLRQIVAQNPGALKKLFGKKASESDIIIKHCLNVCALATKMAEKENFSSQIMDDLATAGLVHDIGITKLSKSEQTLFSKPREKFTLDDRRLFNFHVRNGVDLLNGKSYINENIINLVLNHEETLSGSGPQHKKKLEKTEEILSLADRYDLKITVSQMTPREAIKDIQINELGNYSLETINNLKEVVAHEGLLDS